jgi:hypothetical protein
VERAFSSDTSCFLKILGLLRITVAPEKGYDNIGLLRYDFTGLYGYDFTRLYSR